MPLSPFLPVDAAVAEAMAYECKVWSDFFDAAEWDGTVSWLQGLRFVHWLGYLDSFSDSPWWALMNERLDAGELAAWVEEQGG